VLLGSFLLLGRQAICCQRVRRPVVRFIVFYKSAEREQFPISWWERVAFGIAVAAHEPPKE
jgi:hypothetical protein